MISSGVYKVVIKDCQQGLKCKYNKKDMLLVTLEIIDGKFKGKVIKDYIVDNARAVERVVNILNSCDVKVQRFSPACIKDKECYVSVSNIDERKLKVERYY